MSGLVLLWAGTLLAATGAALAVGTAAVSRLELSRWVAERRRGAGLATALLTAPGRVLGTATAVATVGTLLATFGAAAILAPAPVLVATAMLVAGVPALLLATYVVPRAVGRRWAEPIVRAAAPWLHRTALLARPFVPTAATPRADLTTVLRREDPERLHADELAVLAGLIAFTERPVRTVMTPRTEIVAVAEGAPFGEVATIVTESGYSRVPVYRGTLDQIVGMVHALDVVKAGTGGALPVRPVTVVPASRRCADLLFEMQRERRQFAVVLDEYGGTAGIATLEDLLEELVGEIFDEYDEASADPPADVELLEVDGATPSDDVATRFGVEFALRSETVGGLLAAALGRIPRTGERVVLAGLEFDVLGATPARVERLVIRRVRAEPPGPRPHGAGP